MNKRHQKTRKCPSCNGQSKRRGKNKSGSQRYQCLSCGKTFTAGNRKKFSKKKWLGLFEEYVLCGATYRLLSKVHKIPVRTLESQFHRLFEEEPPNLYIPETQREESYLIIDGKWFGKKQVMMVYRRSDTKTILYISFLKKEYGSQIARDLEHLRDLGYKFTCVVSDGGTGIKKAVNKAMKNTPHQICMAHMHRRVISCLGKYPKQENTKELKIIADHIWLIESREALIWWLEQLNDWVKRNNKYLWERRTDDTGRKWFAHTKARSAVTNLFFSAKNCFEFINHPLIPKTSNQLEATIGVLTDKKRIHRGLKETRTQSFLKWFIYFYNKDKMSS